MSAGPRGRARARPWQRPGPWDNLSAIPGRDAQPNEQTMARMPIPASPADDLSARRGPHDRLAQGSVLTAELSAFLQSGVSVILASVRPDRTPVAGIALACRVDPNGSVRVLLPRARNDALLDAIQQGGAIAATFSRPRDHRSIQLKASAACVVNARSDDLPEITRQCCGMRDELISADYAPAFAAAFVAFEPSALAAIEFFPARAFVQTPGPGAGSELPS